jgi:hypothetical protein
MLTARAASSAMTSSEISDCNIVRSGGDQQRDGAFFARGKAPVRTSIIDLIASSAALGHT